MDSAGYPESPMEQDDAAYPCKGCGEILEEGKAFELAGNRWHIDCFRCNTCGTILDSDANLLLLGDGSLICNNCTYSCSVCGNKIEDLAILTGDQAFCATCFKCRNCKKKIENLKYARTSQGIFCMECHESLMQRRRKKNHKNGTNRHKLLQQAPSHTMLLDKSLPSLPPSAVDRSAFSPDLDSPISEPYEETPTEVLPPQRKKPATPMTRSEHSTPEIPREIPRAAQKRPPYQRSQSSRSEKEERVRLIPEDDRKENLGLPATTYSQSRQSALLTKSDDSALADDFFIPMALDPNLAPGPSPFVRKDQYDMQRDPASPPPAESKSNARDYFNNKKAAARKLPNDQDSLRKVSGETPNDSRNNSRPNSPHIAYQERNRTLPPEVPEYSRTNIKDLDKNFTSDIPQDFPREAPYGDPRDESSGEAQNDSSFTLQDAPKRRKSEKRNSRPDNQPPMVDTTILAAKSKSEPVSANTNVKEQHVTVPPRISPISSRSDATLSGSPRDIHTSRGQASSDSPKAHSSPLGNQIRSIPERGDSLTPHGKQAPIRREIDAGAGVKTATSISSPENRHDPPASAPPAVDVPPAALIQTSGNRGPLRAQDSPLDANFTDKPPPPMRAKERLGNRVPDYTNDSFASPRAPPHPPQAIHKARNGSISTLKSDSSRNGEQPPSPKLPPHNEKGELCMDEETARIMGHDGLQDHGGFLRRVSHSVRHARSYSDRGTRLSKEQKWPKSPLIGSHSPSYAHDISSPLASSPEAREEISWFKNELRRERQRTMEKDQRLQELEAALDAKSSIKQMNTELREKRSTMVVLDTQKEIVVRELEVLTEHIAAAKKSGEPLDLSQMSNTVLREFAESLQNLKESFSPQIEDLTQQRNDLLDEVSNLAQLKDKHFQEFEQLSHKNAQLADLNNQLVHQIQELYKANAGPSLDTVRPPPNGLGIYTQSTKDRLHASVDSREKRPSIADSNLTGSTAVPEQDTDSATYLTAPQVVNIRKAQPKKFNWKKGGEKAAKGITKGLKGAFSSDGNRGQREGQYIEGMPYGAMSQQEYPTHGKVSLTQMQDLKGPGFAGLFGNPNKQWPQQWKNSPNGSLPAVNSEGVPPLFGSELEVRAEYERVNIPGVVMRCIQEVDARGMDIEGIYRKSGGNGQIQAIKEGFERSNDYDISDPDLDISAVTSTLKQYFRKLPTPLITYEVYDKLLETAAADSREVDPSHPAHASNPNNHPYRVQCMRQAISELPPRHRDTLEVLVFHLARVIEQEKENLMTSLNVAVVFAPTIMRPESLAREMQDTQAKNSAVQFLIENCQGVFMGGDSVRERERSV